MALGRDGGGPRDHHYWAWPGVSFSLKGTYSHWMWFLDFLVMS